MRQLVYVLLVILGVAIGSACVKKEEPKSEVVPQKQEGPPVMIKVTLSTGQTWLVASSTVEFKNGFPYTVFLTEENKWVYIGPNVVLEEQ